MQAERTSFPDAVRTLLDVLEKRESFSISGLSREAGLNRRTVEKALELLLDIQKHFLENKLDVIEMNRLKLIQLSARSGLLGLPENLQKLIIRTVYYPTPSMEQEILTHLYLRGAFLPENAVLLTKSGVIQKLIRQGQILENEGKFYLSDEGRIVAEGTLKLYPELKDVAQ